MTIRIVRLGTKQAVPGRGPSYRYGETSTTGRTQN